MCHLHFGFKEFDGIICGKNLCFKYKNSENLKIIIMVIYLIYLIVDIVLKVKRNPMKTTIFFYNCHSKFKNIVG